MKVTHDIHTHTLFSSCCYDPAATMAAFVDKANELGHTTLGIANHLWDEAVPGCSPWYKGQTLNYVLEGKYAIPADTKGLRVLFGAEVEYCAPTDTLAITAEDAKNFDYILVPHTHTHMRDFVFPEPAEVAKVRADVVARMQAALPEFSEAQILKMTAALKHADLYPAAKDKFDLAEELAVFCLDSLEKLLANPEFAKLAATVPTLIAHPVSPGEDTPTFLAAVAKINKERFYELCKKAASMNLVFDINMGSFRASENEHRDDPMVALMKLAKQAGIKFGCSTDTHSVKGLEGIRKADIVSAAIGITEADLWDMIV